MESFLEAPFHFDDTRLGADKNDGSMSPGSVRRLEAAYFGNSVNDLSSNSSKPTSPVESRDATVFAGRKPRARSPTQPSSTGAHLRLTSFGAPDGLDADFNFFSSPQGGRSGSISAELQQHYLNGRNSLGLLDDSLLNLSPQAPSAPSMAHSQSAAGNLDRHISSDWSASTVRKQQQNSSFAMGSFGALGDSMNQFDAHYSPASLAFRNGSISGESYHASTQHPSRHDFSIVGQSPKSTRHSPATHLGFGQAGSPETPSRPLAGLSLSPSDMARHASLMALSAGGGLRGRGSTDMGPPSSTQRSNPAMNLAKRGMFDGSADESNKRRTSPTQRIVDASDEPTPLASSSSTFGGPRPNISPATPYTPRHQQQLSTPSSAFSSASTTPDDAASMTRQISGSGSTSSPFTPASTRSGSLGNELNIGEGASFDEPLDRMWTKQDGVDGSSPDKAAMGGNDYDGGNLSLFHRRVQHPGMTRMASAPSITPISVSSANQHRSGETSMPSTPSDCPPDSAVSWVSSVPGTPGDVTALGFSSPGGFDPYFSSTGMAHSRSHGALPSSTFMSPPSIAPLTLHDANSGVMQTPSRHRHSGSDASAHDYLGSPLGPPKSLKKAGSATPGSAGPGAGGYFSPASTSTTPKKQGGRSSSGAPPPLVVSSADKVHVCHCGKRFKRMEHLKRHNRTHTQERPHKCPVEGCGKYFGRTDNLAQHMKTHLRVNGLARASEHLLALTNAQQQQHHQHAQHAGAFGDGPIDLRHDPHAAAAHAAQAAMKAAAAAQAGGKRRSSTISHPSGSALGLSSDDDVLGGPISLTKQGSTGGGAGDAMSYQHGHFSSPQQHGQQQHFGSPYGGQEYQQQQGGRSVLTQSASANASPNNAFTTNSMTPTSAATTSSPFNAVM